ncbi:MAG: HEAT repeat domain-containing protein [Proteobacteria bacterium]|nr:HEAT repeat domain-containing protein [Pseudomonadota bacterium]
MTPANYNTVAANAARQAGLMACILLFVNVVTAQNAFDDRQVLADSATSYLNVEMSDDLVTLTAHNVDLRDVLDEIARQSDLIVVSHDPLTHRLTLDIERLPLSEALNRIMRGQSYLLYQAQAATGARNANHERPSTLWVFSGRSADHPGHTQAAVRFSSDPASAIKVLRAELMSDDIHVRQEAIKGLRRLEANEAIAPLSFALADEDKKVRVKAIYALAHIGGDDAGAALATASGDENAWVRAETAYALGMIGGDIAIQVLKHALQDADSDVRQSAIEALTEIGGGQSARALAIALQDADVSLRVEAVEALADIGGETAIRLLNQALEDQDNAVRKAANGALAELLSQDL